MGGFEAGDMESKQRWIGSDGDYYFEWTSAWVLDIVFPDGMRIHLTHEEGDLPAEVL
jgi:hypothetical protein